MEKSESFRSDQKNRLYQILEARFQSNKRRHAGIEWDEVLLRLESVPEKLYALSEMERTGGEPDVTGRDEATGQIIFYDCAAESPAGRRSLCYDETALDERKKDKPKGSALGMAKVMGISILTEEQYRALQALGPFDQKTSGWLFTPADIRRLGGALFGDFRYGRTFIYHNGVQTYYAARGFRGCLSV